MSAAEKINGFNSLGFFDNKEFPERAKRHLKERYLLNTSFLNALTSIKKDDLVNIERLYMLYLSKSNEITKEFSDLDSQLNNSLVINSTQIESDKDVNIKHNIAKTISDHSPPREYAFATSAIHAQSLNKNKKIEFSPTLNDTASVFSRSPSLQSRPFAPKIPSKLSGLVGNNTSMTPAREKRSREPDSSDISTDSVSKDKRSR